MSNHQTLMTEAEILSVAGARYNDAGFIVLSMRLNPENFMVHNLGLKPEQAVRLWRDLTMLAQTSEVMKKAIEETPNHYDNFKRIMLEEAPPPKKGRGRKKKSE